MRDSFSTRRTLESGGRRYHIASLPALAERGYPVGRLPYSTRILLENLLRREDGETVTAADVEALARWDAKAEPTVEIAFMPARVLLQDFTGVPAVVDLAAMRDAMRALGGDPEKINPLQPVELVIDHSVQVDEYGSAAALLINAEKEFERNRERYAFLRWGQRAFRNFRVVPPATGIVHQVNLEYLARGVMVGAGEEPFAYPDTLVGTDSHTTMINGLGVLGWGVGGIEAEAAMLGQPISMLIPQVTGFRLRGELPEGATATDLVLRVTEMLRRHGVVGRLVEFYGPGLARLPLADRATIANMAPEYGATCGIFPIDRVSLDYLRFTGRDAAQVALVEAYFAAQGLLHDASSPEPAFTDVLELDLGSVEPSLAGPRRPQDRVALSQVAAGFRAQLPSLQAKGRPAESGGKGPALNVVSVSGVSGVSGGGGTAVAVAEAKTAEAKSGAQTRYRDADFELQDGSVVIAAITSCTNTSNPSVMVAAGLLAKKAHARGLVARPWVKTSLAPGSKVVTRYLEEAGLLPELEALGFHVVGYGCTTCIGNSGPLPAPIKAAIDEGSLVAVAVLSGNRNFEGRISPDVRANYLASPPLVVAYALAGRIDVDLTSEPLANDPEGRPVYLRDLWPTSAEVAETVERALHRSMFESEYADVFAGDAQWQALPTPEGATFDWDPASTYVRQPPYFVDMTVEPPPPRDLVGARVLAVLGDSVTTDHISPAGSIKRDGPAGRYLMEHGVGPLDFNSYGSRRGNHEVMLRGTFANVRLRNKLVDIEGGYTVHLPSGEPLSIYDAALRYQREGVPLAVLAGQEYGAGSSRDWAAKGTMLLGVRIVIAASFERIHRSNLVGMGILPTELLPGDALESLGLDGRETYDFPGLAELVAAPFAAGRELDAVARRDDGGTRRFRVRVRLDTPKEVDYFRHGGILPYVLRQLL